MIVSVNYLVDIWESRVDFGDQCNFEGVVRIFVLENNRPVGDKENIREIFDDCGFVKSRSHQIATENVQGQKEIRIKHVSNPESVSNSFYDGW